MMEHDMMMPMGPTIFGLDLASLLMAVSGIFYIISAIFVFKAYRKEKNELLGALLAFLVYQAVSMFFMGTEMLTHNMLFGNIAGFAVLVGSAYMLKFPLSQFSKGVRQTAFFIVLIAALGVFGWFMQTEAHQMKLMNFVFWYDMIANGILAGGSIMLYGLKIAESRLKRKALTGGTGVLSCCLAANGFMLASYMLVGSIVSFLAPILILASLRIGKGGDSSSSVSSTPTVTPTSTPSSTPTDSAPAGTVA